MRNKKGQKLKKKKKHPKLKHKDNLDYVRE